MLFNEFKKSLKQLGKGDRYKRKLNKLLIEAFQFYDDSRMINENAQKTMDLIIEGYDNFFYLYIVESVFFYKYIKYEKHRWDYQNYSHFILFSKDNSYMIMAALMNTHFTIEYKDENNDSYRIAILKVDPSINKSKDKAANEMFSFTTNLFKSVMDKNKSVIAFKDFDNNELINVANKNKAKLKYSVFWYFSHLGLEVENYDKDIFIVEKYDSKFSFVLSSYVRIKDDIISSAMLFYKDENNNEYFICNYMDKDIQDQILGNQYIDDAFKLFALELISPLNIYSKLRFLYLDYAMDNDIIDINYIMDNQNK